MRSADRVAAAFGMDIISVSPGRAEVSMVVRDDMLNGHELCHGGLIFTLADTALAYASNSHGPASVAAAASIDFVNPARAGAVLTAAATETFRRGRTSLYDVIVTDDGEDLIARFHGRCQVIRESPTN